MALHETYVYATIDDDGLHMGCVTCPEFVDIALGHQPDVKDIIQADQAHAEGLLFDSTKRN